jgi:hypothetical protein
MATEAGELVLELGDPQRLGLHQRDQALGGHPQFGRVFGQRLGPARHGWIIAQRCDPENPLLV